MKTIQMEIDDSLLAEVEWATKASGATPSEFICNAIRLVLREEAILLLEKNLGKVMPQNLLWKMNLMLGKQNRFGVMNESRRYLLIYV
jgi:hypothetical protein